MLTTIAEMGQQSLPMPLPARCTPGHGSRCSRAHRRTCRCDCGGRNHGVLIGQPLPKGTPLQVPKRWLSKPEDYCYFIEGSFNLEPLRFWKMAKRGKPMRGYSNIPFSLSNGGESMDWLSQEGWANTCLNALAMFVPPGGAWQWRGSFMSWLAARLAAGTGDGQDYYLPAQDVRDWLQARWLELARR